MMISTPAPATIPLIPFETGKNPSGLEATSPCRHTAEEIRQMLCDIAWVLHWTQRVKHDLVADRPVGVSAAYPNEQGVMPADLPV